MTASEADYKAYILVNPEMSRLRVHTMNPLNDFERCPICFEDMENCVELKCGHCFHLKCIDIWLNQYQRNCPYCRSDVSPPPSPSNLPAAIVIPPPPPPPAHSPPPSPPAIIVQQQYTCCEIM